MTIPSLKQQQIAFRKDYKKSNAFLHQPPMYREIGRLFSTSYNKEFIYDDIRDCFELWRITKGYV